MPSTALSSRTTGQYHEARCAHHTRYQGRGGGGGRDRAGGLMRTSLGLSGDPARGAPQRRAFRSETRRATRAALTQHTDATTHTDVRARGPRGSESGRGGARGTRARTHARCFLAYSSVFRPHARAAPRGGGRSRAQLTSAKPPLPSRGDLSHSARLPRVCSSLHGPSPGTSALDSRGRRCTRTRPGWR